MGSVELDTVIVTGEAITADKTAALIQERIRNSSLVKKLRADPTQKESRPHAEYPPSAEWRNLFANTFIRPGIIEIPPYIWTQKEEQTLTMIFHVGSDICGHPGIVHGGFSSAVFDEALARCAFPVLPSKVGVTASLQVDYKKPVMANQILVLKAKVTEVNGRKAWVEGHIESLIEGEDADQATSVPLVAAKGLFVEPRSTYAMQSTYRVDA
ncbi:thioesterase family protein [Xylogone sp. PMI_703]|nr:thioesterase family protein [Xylogone sp. PMI_703]